MIKQYLMMLIALVTVFVSITGAVVLAENSYVSPHENPEEAVQIFSGISLLGYYSISLDYIIQRDRAGSEINLEKVSFANIPSQMENITADFADYGKDFTSSLVELYDLWNKQNVFINQYRLSEAADIYQKMQNKLPAARQQLGRIETSVIATGDYLKVDMVPDSNALRLTYDEVLAKIQQLYLMLDLLDYPLLPELLPDLTPEELAELLKHTEISLEINPMVAYVGDEIIFRGILSTQGEKLAGREIRLLLNGLDILTVKTDVQGYYQGKFQLPFQYLNEVSVQALFYPHDDDAGVYLASVSPIIEIAVLYYEAQLTILKVESAYPGREAIINGYLTYVKAPPLPLRQAELYFDNVFLRDFIVETSFTEKMELSEDTIAGEHIISIFVPADGRYAPVFADCVLEITRAVPIIELDIPRIEVVPGSIEISGRIFSEFGPLDSAYIIINLGEKETPGITDKNGLFTANIKMSMGLSLLGNQQITVKAQPIEPWNAPLSVTKNIFLVNVVNCSIVLILLSGFGLYLPRRFIKWSGINLKKKIELPETPIPVNIITKRVDEDTHSEKRDEPDEREKAVNPVLYWYRLALKFVQNFTGLMLKPQRTLREYAHDVSRVLGPAGKYFMELTFIIEKTLYARWRPSPQDIERSQKLSQSLQEETKGENK